MTRLPANLSALARIGTLSYAAVPFMGICESAEFIEMAHHVRDVLRAGHVEEA
ncbi:hypothetical protein [Pseudoroseicyclus tamaricis]|uniref:Uncharacterized protein n=1 Tax=Pseudoroseicyclus tamaricis TaxID=2705421 RepID=A0A6B2JNU8_9RHOB|nr:hypothetical protein [Pseudoroseicyclus tamaricis]NDU99717.1 hypothetical protein [Pseudoroseicyclus tamaricis]